MKTRRRHQSIAFLVTVIFMISGIYALGTSRMASFLILCTAYVVFLLIFSLICWLSLPRQLRRRPPMPNGFEKLKAGPINRTIGELIGRCTLEQERFVGPTRHRLFTSENSFPEGVWSCRIEESGNRIIACEVSFKSSASPVMDWGCAEGSGQFIVFQS